MQRKTLLGCGVLVLVLVVFALVSFWAIRYVVRGPGLPGRFVLVVPLSGEIREAHGIEWTQLLVFKRPLTLWDIVRAIDRAAEDRRVRGIVVRMHMPSMGFAKAQELRAALQRFRNSGKPVVVYAELLTDRDYLVATAADRIVMAPGGFVAFNGVVAQFISIKGLLDKLGITAQMIQFGPYKSAGDVYTKEHITPEVREMLTWIAESLDMQYLQALRKSRPKVAAQWDAVLARGLILADEAQTRGLIDEVQPWIAFRKRIREEWATKWVQVSRYVRDLPEPRGRRKVKCALILAVGVISTGKGNPGESIGSEQYVRWLEQIARDDQIRCVLIRDDSPGGSGTASDEIWQAIERVKQKGKKVVVSMSDVAGSGGYYIAMNADRIVAQPGTITGSIGVVGGKFVLRGTAEKVGVHVAEVPARENAGMWSSFTPWNDTQIAQIRRTLRRFYRQFVRKVAQGRNLSVEAVEAVAEGRIWTGAQALEHKLVDRLGGFSEAIEELRTLLHLPKDTVLVWKVYPRPRSPWEILLQPSGMTGRPHMAVPAWAYHSNMRRWLEAMSVLHRESVAYLMLPVEIGWRAYGHAMD